jgi:hypothetical protein
MKKFLANILLFGTVFFAFDKLFIFVRDYSPETEADRRLEMLINGEINREIIVLGASRGARDVIAHQVERETGRSAYNLSYPGSDIEFHEFLLRTLIAFDRAPKTILLVVDDPSELLPSVSITYRLDRLYPLVKYPYIREELARRGEKNALLMKLFVLHQLSMGNFDLRKKSFSSLDTIRECGSMPVSFRREGRVMEWGTADTLYTEADEVAAKVSAFRKFVETCRQHSIDLVIVFPPNFKAQNNAFERRLETLAGDEAGRMSFDPRNPAYTDPQYFYDESHLTTEGAEIFTRDVSVFLRTRSSLRQPERE